MSYENGMVRDGAFPLVPAARMLSTAARRLASPEEAAPEDSFSSGWNAGEPPGAPGNWASNSAVTLAEHSPYARSRAWRSATADEETCAPSGVMTVEGSKLVRSGGRPQRASIR